MPLARGGRQYRGPDHRISTPYGSRSMRRRCVAPTWRSSACRRSRPLNWRRSLVKQQLVISTCGVGCRSRFKPGYGLYARLFPGVLVRHLAPDTPTVEGLTEASVGAELLIAGRSGLVREPVSTPCTPNVSPSGTVNGVANWLARSSGVGFRPPADVQRPGCRLAAWRVSSGWRCRSDVWWSPFLLHCQ